MAAVDVPEAGADTQAEPRARPEAPAVLAVLAVLLAGAFVLWFASLVTPWGDTGDGPGAVSTALLRAEVVAALVPLAAVAARLASIGLGRLDPLLLSPLVWSVVAVAVPGLTALVLWNRLEHQIDPRPGGYLLLAALGLTMVAGVLTAVATAGSRTPVTAAAVAIVAAVALLAVPLGAAWWPGRDISHTTGPPLAGNDAVPTTVNVVRWSQPLSHARVAGAFGGRLIESYLVDPKANGTFDYLGCRVGVRGRDATGRVVWHFESPGVCDMPDVDGSQSLIRVNLGFPARHDRQPIYRYFDPTTGRQLHPGAWADDVVQWVGSFGIITQRGPDQTKDIGRRHPAYTTPGITAVDAKTGRRLVDSRWPGCEQGRLLGTSFTVSRVFDSVGGFGAAAAGPVLAVPFACSDPTAAREDLGREVTTARASVLLLDTRAGQSRTVTLSTPSIGVGTALEGQVYPLLHGVGDRFVGSYLVAPASGGSSAGWLDIGLDQSGQVSWQAPRADDELAILSYYWQPLSPTQAIIVRGGAALLDARTGQRRLVQPDAVPPNGVGVAGRYVAADSGATNRLALNLVTVDEDGGVHTTPITVPPGLGNVEFVSARVCALPGALVVIDVENRVALGLA